MPTGVYIRTEEQKIAQTARLPHFRTDPITRFWSKVIIQDNGCWLWNGCLAHPQGYGRLNINGEAEYAHIFIYELFWGPIPKEKEIDHLCRNRACVNPFHLEAVTTQVNCLRGNSPAAISHREAINRGPHCKHGHPWLPENTYYRKSGGRVCRTCHREQEAIAKGRRNGKNSKM